MNDLPEALDVVHTTVFSEAVGGGNPCPVVLGADELEDETMRHVALHYGQESGFVLTPTRGDCAFRLRYFVPNHEMEMCVHATVASVRVLLGRGQLPPTPVQVETALGALALRRSSGPDPVVLVEQFSPTYSQHNPSPDEVARALGIGVTDLNLDPFPLQSVSCSRPKLIVPLKDPDVLQRLQPDFEILWTLCDQFQTTGLYPFAPREEGGAPRLEARQFPRRAGYPEDPATGVAAAALGAYLVAHQQHFAAGSHAFTVRQGQAMGRPSVIQVQVEADGERCTAVWVGGQAELLGQALLPLGSLRATT